MFPKIISLVILVSLLAACAAQNPPLPAGEGLGVRETPPPTLTPSPAPTETPTSTPEPMATPTPEPEIPDYILNIKTVNNPTSWRLAPEINIKDTPALAFVLMERFNNGEFNDSIPENFHYVPFNFNVSGFKYHGITMALNPLVGNPKDLYGMENRWYFLSSLYKDSASGATIGHYFIKQKDGSVGQYFATIGINIEKVAHGDINDLIGYIAGNDRMHAAPADLSEPEGCLELTAGDTAYCDFYVSNRDSILDLYKEWAKTGFVPKQISTGEVIIPLQGRSVKKP